MRVNLKEKILNQLIQKLDQQKQNNTLTKKKILNLTQDTIDFQLDSTELANELEEYVGSVKRDFRALRKLGLIYYEPVPIKNKQGVLHNLSSLYKFSCNNKKTTYQNLLNCFNEAISKVKALENPNTESYKVREILHNAKTI